MKSRSLKGHTNGGAPCLSIRFKRMASEFYTGADTCFYCKDRAADMAIS